MLKMERMKNDSGNGDELVMKVKLLEEEIDEKQRELEINKKITNEALEQLSHFQVHNTFLRSHIEAIEEKLQDFIKESPPDIGKNVQQSLDSLNICLIVEQVTENIFKVENETLHLFFEKGVLMAQQGGKTVSFNEWVQRYSAKVNSNHKRSKSEDIKLIAKESTNTIEASLDIVPEAEVEHEDEPLKKTATPMKQLGNSKTMKKSPSGKGIRSYSPILSKKKGK
jgi:hypothetical protein